MSWFAGSLSGGGGVSGALTFSGAQPQIVATLGLGCRSSLVAGDAGTDFKFDTLGVTRTAGVLFGFYNNSTSVLRYASDTSRLYVTGSGGLTLEGGGALTAGTIQIQNETLAQSNTNGSIILKGNRNAADTAAADVVVNSTATRNAGLLLDVQNNGTSKFAVGFDGRFGFFGVTPQARPAAYTQTYATATRTHSDPTGLALTDSTGGTASNTIANSGAAYSQSNQNDFRASITDEVNKHTADIANIKQLVNSIIDDLQGYGLSQ